MCTLTLFDTIKSTKSHHFLSHSESTWPSPIDDMDQSQVNFDSSSESSLPSSSVSSSESELSTSSSDEESSSSSESEATDSEVEMNTELEHEEGQLRDNHVDQPSTDSDFTITFQQGKEPFCSGSSLSLFLVSILIITFVFKHNLTKSAWGDF